ncbi:hypothetical protein UlMin_039066 [Ulmus minor]
MERLFKPYDKEYMKMAMLKHEEIFKEQVYELHRLYQIQKILMKNMEKTRSNVNRPQIRKIDLEQQPAVEESLNGDDHGRMLEIIDESEIELTLRPTSYNRRRKTEAPLTSDSGPSFSSSSTGSSQMNRASYPIHCPGDNGTGLDLTGSGGCQLGLVQVPFSVDEVEEENRKGRLKRPPNWLFQVLSLNVTS